MCQIDNEFNALQQKLKTQLPGKTLAQVTANCTQRMRAKNLPIITTLCNTAAYRNYDKDLTYLFNDCEIK